MLFSLLVARLITPMLAAYFLRDNAHLHEEKDGPILRGLMAILRWSLDHRGRSVLMGLGVFALSIYSATLLPTEFIPAGDVGRSQISVELPPGATISDTEAEVRRISQIAAREPEVISVFANGGDGSNEASNGMYLLMLSHKNLKQCESTITVGRQFQQRFPQHIRAAEALYSVGQCQYDMQQKDIARETWKRVRVLYPHSAAAKRAAQQLK